MPHTLKPHVLKQVMNRYLEHSTYIDWQHPSISTLAKQLRASANHELATAKNCFDYVRDEIRHSVDYKVDIITCKASDVLAHTTGYCYAKSHLLAALLRANGIAAGLCYQRLSVQGDGAPYCLHGLNAVYLQNYGWYRIDPRGNKPGVNAQFSPPHEQLAFATCDKLEADLQGIWPTPLPVVTDVLERYSTYTDVLNNLPDIALFTTTCAQPLPQ